MQTMTNAAVGIVDDAQRRELNRRAAGEYTRLLLDQKAELMRQIAALRDELARRDEAASMDYEIERGRLVRTWM